MEVTVLFLREHLVACTDVSLCFSPAQIRLIEEVEQRRELWDITAPNYQLTFKRKNVVWDEIAAKLNLTSKEIWDSMAESNKYES